MVNNNSSGAILLGNTSDLNSEDLKNFISLSEEINERQRLSDQHSANNQLPKAHLKRQEIFECSVIDDDKFLSALEYQNSVSGTTQITDLDVTQSFENMMKYFDEDVHYRSSNSSTPTLQQIGNRVASVVAKLNPKSIKLTSQLNKPTKKEKSIKYPSVKALKAKYEPGANQEKEEADAKQSAKNSAVKNVKQMAQMFNNKISQIINGPKPYAQIEKEFPSVTQSISKPKQKLHPSFPIYSKNKGSPISSPKLKRKPLEPKPVMSKEIQALPKANEKVRTNFRIYHNNKASPVASPSLRRKMHAKSSEDDSACLVTEEVFRKLSVKDKALLYQKFIEDMSLQSAEFKQHAKQLEEHIRNKFIDDGVVIEKQQKVKQLARQIEAKMGVPRQTVSDMAIKYMPQYKTLPNTKSPVMSATTNTVKKAKEAEDANQNKRDFSHVSELKVYLKSPNTGKTIFSSQHVTRVESPDVADIRIYEPSFKRSNDMIRNRYSTEAYAPPKKIRRMRTERLTPKSVFQNTQIESMFYVWLKEKNGVSFDIKSNHESTKNNIINPEKINDTVQLSTNTLETTLDWTNSLLEQETAVSFNDNKSLEILNRELKPLESPRLLQSLKKPKEQRKIESKAKIKRQAPPIPTSATNERTSSESSSNSKPSEMEMESESSAVSVPKLTSDDSQPERQCNNIQLKETNEKKTDFEFLKPTRPPRKKKMRRTLTWKKENSIVETAAIASTTTTDSDSDFKAAAEAKKKITTYAVQKAMKKCNNQLRKFIFSSTNNLNQKEQSTHNDQSIDELNKSLLSVLYSSHKIRSAYTLTVLSSPSPYTESEHGETEALKTPRYCETSRSLPSIRTAVEEENLKQNEHKSTSMEMTQNHQHENKKSIIDSFTDQGFETESNELENSLHKRSKSPLFFKLSSSFKKPEPQHVKPDSSDSACESPLNCSTPFKENSQDRVSMNSHGEYLNSLQAPAKPRRRMLEPESRRSSIAMQVIREDQPWDISEMHNVKLPVDKNEINSGKTSNFWVTAGDITTSLPIYYNTPDRVRLLLDIFCQKSTESSDWHFGIDDHKFTINKPNEQECIKKRLPSSKDTSHYWFSTGDLAVPFNGKYCHPTKILRLFKFIRENLMEATEARLRFGIDEFEFSRVPDNLSTSPKFSLESNYSSCLRLQGNDSLCYEDRRQYSWPNTSNTMKTNDPDQSELNVDASDTSRISITPMSCNSTGYNSPIYSGRESDCSPFRFSFGNESLDKLFEHVKNIVN